MASLKAVGHAARPVVSEVQNWCVHVTYERDQPDSGIDSETKKHHINLHVYLQFTYHFTEQWLYNILLPWLIYNTYDNITLYTH